MIEINNIRTPEDHCLSCGEQSDCVRAIGHNTAPRPGDFTICRYCGHLMAFAPDLKRRELTDEETVRIAGDPELIRMQKILKTAKDLQAQDEDIQIEHPSPLIATVLTGFATGMSVYGYHKDSRVSADSLQVLRTVLEHLDERVRSDL